MGVEEYGYVAPAALRRGGKYRFVRTMPLIFSTVDPHVLYLGSNVLLKTINGGHSWDIISPDLTRQTYETPPSMGIFAALDPEKANIAASFTRLRRPAKTLTRSGREPTTAGFT